MRKFILSARYLHNSQLNYNKLDAPRAVVMVAQLTERLSPIPEDSGSNLAIGNFIVHFSMFVSLAQEGGNE